MSLATRCTACGTVFRIVQDQLKVSEGWVRCGRCNEVFNALEGLFDLQRDTPPDWPAAASASASASAPHLEPPMAPPVDASFDVGNVLPQPDADPFGNKIDAQLMGSREAGHDSTPATRVSERDRLDFPDAQFDPDMMAEDTIELGGIAAADTSSGTDPVAPAEAVAPGFVRRAQRRAHWQSPGMRALQLSALCVLLATLALQSAHHFRDALSARWPDTTAAFAAWCQFATCAIEAPKRIEDVAVESTALARVALPDAFRLSVVLRNRGTSPVTMPSIDLSLTDAAGQLVARRVLSPREFRAASTLIKPGAESPLQLVLAAAGARVTGYTVEVFYP